MVWCRMGSHLSPSYVHKLRVVARHQWVSLEFGVLADRVHRGCFVLSNHRILP